MSAANSPPWNHLVRNLLCGLHLIIGVGVCWTVAAQGGPSTIGQWSSVQAWPYRAIHSQLLPTGKVLFWDSYENADVPQLSDPATRTVSPAARAGPNAASPSLQYVGSMASAEGNTYENSFQN